MAVMFSQSNQITKQLVSEWKFDQTTATYLLLLRRKQRSSPVWSGRVRNPAGDVVGATRRDDGGAIQSGPVTSQFHISMIVAAVSL
ncbi:maternal embryonic leucine zipper kinase-like [Trichomycterus rosablanca]|uniref:maternal embryonic leucine zipper kinase-like n=1 Tax=Trichomycterus rosablanca TaxID=2290929 RepID=UPI002F354853